MGSRMIDHLTMLANRRYFEIRVTQQLSESRRYGWGFGLLFIDIDHFKNINDQYGHEAGDRVLRMVAGTMISAARPFDVLGRWGGEEFTGSIVNVSQDQLSVISNRWHNLIGESRLYLDNGDAVKVTVSIGATLARSDDKLATLIKRADKLMYESKKAGRNRVTVG